MCGPKFCSMHHSRTIDEAIERMARDAAHAAGAENAAAVADQTQIPEKGALSHVGAR
jgi:hypothetical protein